MPKTFAELFGNDTGDLLPKTPLAEEQVRTLAPTLSQFHDMAQLLSSEEVRTVPVPLVQPAEVTLAQLAAVPFGYLSGPAGTGKTFLARQLVTHMAGAQLCATTGIAAVNLGDATTINSLLRYYDTKSLVSDYHNGWLQMKLRKLRRSGLRRIVLDEVSMLDAEQLDTLCYALDEVNDTQAYDSALDSTEYDAGDDRLGLLLVGDFAQLPPVKAKFAFEAIHWDRFAEHTWKLTTVRRQTDQPFVEALMDVRAGRATRALPVFEPRMAAQNDLEFDGTTIVARNEIVDRVNLTRHAKLRGELCTYATIRSGEQHGDWIKQVPNEVGVKVGALVMILANKRYPSLDLEDTPGLIYANGDLATVVGKGTSGLRVHLHRTQSDVEVTFVTREWKEPTGKKKPPYTVKGTVSYMPVRLAYATTVHKCVAGYTRIPVLGQGYVPIEELVGGETTPYGQIKAVVQTGTRPAYRITTKKGYTVVCSAEHRWMTDRGLRETRELSPQYRVELNHGVPFGGKAVLTYDQAWTLGAIVGDGCYTDRDDGTMELACAHGPFGELFKLRAEEAWGVTPKWRKDRRGLNWTKKAHRQQLRELGLDYVLAPGKRVPHAVWELGPIERGAFLSGLFDADGHVARHRIVLTTASERLGQEVQELLLTLGIVSKRTSYPGVRDSIYWQVYIAAECRDRFLQWVGFQHPDKQQRAREHRPNRALRPTLGFDTVATVELIGVDVPMYDIEIPRPHLVPFGPLLGHNSQGLSLDRVQVNIVDHFFGSPSMAYVALSRARTLEGLRIVGTPKMFLGRCVTEKKVQGWI